MGIRQMNKEERLAANSSKTENKNEMILKWGEKKMSSSRVQLTFKKK